MALAAVLARRPVEERLPGQLHALPLRTGVSGAQSQQARPHCNPAQARHTAHLLNVTGLKLHDEQDLTAQRDGLTALGIVTDGAYDDHGLTGTPAPGPVYARPSSARSTRPLANTRPSGVQLPPTPALHVTPTQLHARSRRATDASPTAAAVDHGCRPRARGRHQGVAL